MLDDGSQAQENSFIYVSECYAPAILNFINRCVVISDLFFYRFYAFVFCLIGVICLYMWNLKFEFGLIANLCRAEFM